MISKLSNWNCVRWHELIYHNRSRRDSKESIANSNFYFYLFLILPESKTIPAEPTSISGGAAQNLKQIFTGTTNTSPLCGFDRYKDPCRNRKVSCWRGSFGYSVKSCVSGIRQDQRMMLISIHSMAGFPLVTQLLRGQPACAPKVWMLTELFGNNTAREISWHCGQRI